MIDVEKSDTIQYAIIIQLLTEKSLTIETQGWIHDPSFIWLLEMVWVRFQVADNTI